MSLSDLHTQILDQRARLISQEPSLTAEAQQLTSQLAQDWAAKVQSMMAQQNLSSTQLSELQRLGTLSHSLRTTTTATLYQIEQRVGTQVQAVFKNEYYRHAAMVQQQVLAGSTSANFSFGALDLNTVKSALSGPIAGKSLTKHFSALGAATDARMQRDLAQAIAEGYDLGKLANKWAGGHGAGAIQREAGMLAITGAHAAANNAQMLVYDKAGAVIPEVQWEATFDSRTCFPAGTLVTTRRGQVPIEQVLVGDEVYTHRRRWRRVLALTNRVFTGPMATVQAGGLSLTSTWDHPLWSDGRGWVAVASLKPGDALVQLGGGHPPVHGTLGQPQHGVPHASQGRITGTIPPSYPGPAVPVVTISLHHQPQGGQVEIGGPAANAVLLQNLDAVHSQQLGDGFFQSRAHAAAVVTAVGTVDRTGPGAVSEHTATVAAHTGGGRPTAPLAAVHGPASPMGSPLAGVQGEGHTTAATGCLHSGVATPSTPVVSAGHGAGYTEHTPAHAAGGSGTMGGYVTGTAAEPAATTPAATDEGGAGFTGVVHSGLGHVHSVPVSSVELASYHGTVHCLVVAEDESFFANGLLVHNCPVCGARHGRSYRKDQAPALPAHLLCRCTWLPVIGDPDLRDAVADLQAYRAPDGSTQYRKADRAFESWLRDAPEYVQRDFWPSEYKYTVWKQTGAPVQAFVRADAAILTDAQVKARVDSGTLWGGPTWSQRQARADAGQLVQQLQVQRRTDATMVGDVVRTPPKVKTPKVSEPKTTTPGTAVTTPKVPTTPAKIGAREVVQDTRTPAQRLMNIAPSVSDAASNKLVQGATEYLNTKVPAWAVQVLEANRVQVKVAHSIVKDYPKIAKLKPRGWKSGTWAQSDGLYSPSGNLEPRPTVLQTTHVSTGGRLSKNLVPTLRQCVPHEIGHAIDSAMHDMRITATKICDSPGFVKAWKADMALLQAEDRATLASLKGTGMRPGEVGHRWVADENGEKAFVRYRAPKLNRDEFHYYMHNESEAGARSEAFAEGWGALTGDTAGNSGYQPHTGATHSAKWPNVTQWIRDLLNNNGVLPP